MPQSTTNKEKSQDISSRGHMSSLNAQIKESLSALGGK